MLVDLTTVNSSSCYRVASGPRYFIFCIIPLPTQYIKSRESLPSNDKHRQVDIFVSPVCDSQVLVKAIIWHISFALMLHQITGKKR